MTQSANGPLAGLRVLEFRGMGAAPFAAMLLADLGASVVAIDRPRTQKDQQRQIDNWVNRGRPFLSIDLKAPDSVRDVLSLVERADVLIEGFRPGVMERLQLGPEPCLASNPRLVYARVTGWGQSGPLAQEPGHDLNYIALSGVLGALGDGTKPPPPPLNIVGDYAGGGAVAALGILAAVLEARASGHGQVVDAAMYEGAALLMTRIFGRLVEGSWDLARGTNRHDGGAPFYQVYETADHGFMAVAASEDLFYERFVRLLGLDPEDLPERGSKDNWPALKTIFAGRFLTRTREEWTEVFRGAEACVTPVMGLDEAPRHGHARARSAFLDVDGALQPAPAPRFSRHGLALNEPVRPEPSRYPDVLRAWDTDSGDASEGR